MSTQSVARRTGGRSARVLDAIYTAVGQLMAEGKPDRITIPMVAERAGVNPTSIYRRWSHIDGLVEEVAVFVDCPCWADRSGQAAVMLGRARDRGEATPTEEQVVDHIIAPLYHHAVFGLQVDQAYADRLVADVLAMAPAGGFTDE